MSIKSLEFYSGIGGMHYGLKGATQNSQVLAAFDINTSANQIYRYNFPNTNLRQNNIEAISVDFLDKMGADLWTMSPPCQPFTKKGLQLGEEDRRADSFAALMEKLEKMANPPRLLFLENVVGFESSTVCENLREMLSRMEYKCKEFILSPIQFGIPNSRPRYYLLASRSPSFSSSPLSTSSPSSIGIAPIPMSCFIKSSQNEQISEKLDEKTLEKYGKAIDVITLSSRRSACFTRSYGTYISGCGSYFCLKEEHLDGQHLSEEAMKNLKNVEIRKLTPREVANLMCFPEQFRQPPGVSNKQMYKTLGNSVNVKVVRDLLSFLLSFEDLLPE